MLANSRRGSTSAVNHIHLETRKSVKIKIGVSVCLVMAMILAFPLGNSGQLHNPGSLSAAPIYTPKEAIGRNPNGPSNLTLFSGPQDMNASIRVVANIQVGNFPDGIGYDQFNGMLYATNFDSNNTSIIDGSTNEVIGSIVTAGGPDAIAVNPLNQMIYVTDFWSDNVAIVDPSARSVSGNITVGSEPASIIYAGISEDIYVADFNSSSVSVINAGNDQFVGNIQVGTAPGAMAYDPNNGRIYVANTGSNNISVVSVTTNSVVGSISVGSSPGSILYDPLNNQIYVGNLLSNNISVISASSSSVIGSINLSPRPLGMALDTANGLLFVNMWGNDTVDALNDVTNAVVATVHVGSSPNAITYDPSNQDIYVTDSKSDSVSVISSPKYYSVSFSESGLPVNTTWSVTLDGKTIHSDNSTITFSVPNGTYSYSVENLAGFVTVPNSGNITVDGKSTAISISYMKTFIVTFFQSGLPNSGEPNTDQWRWYVNLSNGESFHPGPYLWNQTSFAEPHGNYSFSIQPVNGYTPDPSMGNFTVNGTSVNISITFIHPQGYRVNFTEMGMGGSYGSNYWQITINNITESYGTNFSTITFYLSRGNYTYYATTYYSYIQVTPFPSTGKINVNADENITVVFKQNWLVEFSETGLPSHYEWQARLNNLSQRNNTPNIYIKDYYTFNGTYSISAGAKGYYGIEAGSSFSNSFGYVDIVIYIQFFKVYTITVKELGLPNGTEWGVYIGNLFHSYNSSIIIYATGGKWNYTVMPVRGYLAVPDKGTLYLNGNTTLTIVFYRYLTLEFKEAGLAKGQNWSVKVDGKTESSNTSTMLFNVTNGTYSYVATFPEGYYPRSVKGTVFLSSNSSAVTIEELRVYSLSNTWNGIPIVYVGIIIALIAIAIIATGSILMRRGRRNLRK